MAQGSQPSGELPAWARYGPYGIFVVAAGGLGTGLVNGTVPVELATWGFVGIAWAGVVYEVLLWQRSVRMTLIAMIERQETRSEKWLETLAGQNATLAALSKAVEQLGLESQLREFIKAKQNETQRTGRPKN